MLELFDAVCLNEYEACPRTPVPAAPGSADPPVDVQGLEVNTVGSMAHVLQTDKFLEWPLYLMEFLFLSPKFKNLYDGLGQVIIVSSVGVTYIISIVTSTPLPSTLFLLLSLSLTHTHTHAHTHTLYSPHIRT